MRKITTTIATFFFIGFFCLPAQAQIIPTEASLDGVTGTTSLTPSGPYRAVPGLGGVGGFFFGVGGAADADFTDTGGDTEVIGTDLVDGSDTIAEETNTINGDGTCTMVITVSNTNGNDLAPGGFADGAGNPLDTAGVFYGANGGGTPVTFSSPVTGETSLIFSAPPVIAPTDLLPLGFTFTTGSMSVSLGAGSAGQGITEYTLEYIYTNTKCSVILPVELTSFEGNVANGNVTLSWTTASERDNAGFNIEHSIDGEDFSSLGFVDGFGTTTEAHDYSFTASDLDRGQHFFRLKQVDFDGTVSYSDVVESTIDVLGTHEISSLYPNPMLESGKMNLVVAEDQVVDIAVFDVQGRRVVDIANGVFNANVISEVDLNLSSLRSGAYFVVVQGSNFVESRSILLNR